MDVLLYLSADEVGAACISAFSYLVVPHMQVDNSQQGRRGFFFARVRRLVAQMCEYEGQSRRQG